MGILAPADDERFTLLFGEVLHGIKSLHTVDGGYIVLEVGIFLLLSICGSADSHVDVSVGSHAAQFAAGAALTRELVLVVHDGTGGDAGAVGAVRTGSILADERVEDDVLIGKEFAHYIVVDGLALRICNGKLVNVLALFAVCLVGSNVYTLDAQVTVLVFEHRVGEVEAAVYQSDDDTLAGIGLGQVGQSGGLAGVYLVHLRCLAGGVGALTAVLGDVDE